MAKKEVSQQIIHETTAQADKINDVKYGKISYIIQSGKIQRVEISESIQAG